MTLIKTKAKYSALKYFMNKFQNVLWKLDPKGGEEEKLFREINIALFDLMEGVTKLFSKRIGDLTIAQLDEQFWRKSK